MKKVSLNVIHPLTGKAVCVETVDSITIEELILKLVECCVLQDKLTYSLAIKREEDTIVCDPTKKLEDYQISDGNILEVRADGGQMPEKEDLSTVADLEQDGLSAAAALQQDDFSTAGISGVPRIKIKSHIGIKIDEIPDFKLKKFLNQLKDPALVNVLIMLLHDYASLQEENEQNRRHQTREHEKMCDEREKLKNKVREYEKKLSEKRAGTIMMAVSNVVIGVGTAFLTTNLGTAIPTMAAGVVITGLGLWLSFKKGS